jgi:hypothetical protein
LDLNNDDLYENFACLKIKPPMVNIDIKWVLLEIKSHPSFEGTSEHCLCSAISIHWDSITNFMSVAPWIFTIKHFDQDERSLSIDLNKSD